MSLIRLIIFSSFLIVASLNAGATEVNIQGCKTLNQQDRSDLAFFLYAEIDDLHNGSAKGRRGANVLMRCNPSYAAELKKEWPGLAHLFVPLFPDKNHWQMGYVKTGAPGAQVITGHEAAITNDSGYSLTLACPVSSATEMSVAVVLPTEFPMDAAILEANSGATTVTFNVNGVKDSMEGNTAWNVSDNGFTLKSALNPSLTADNEIIKLLKAKTEATISVMIEDSRGYDLEMVFSLSGSRDSIDELMGRCNLSEKVQVPAQK